MTNQIFHKVKSVSPQEDLNLLVVFVDGATRLYDVKQMFDKHPVFEKLKDEKLFSEVKIDLGGCGISWNDDIDIACDELFYNSKSL